MDDRTFDELKEAYVLGALPQDERSAFEDYLATHPGRQAEIDDLAGLAGLLALAPQEHEAPETLRARVMDVVESEARGPGAAATERPSPGSGRFGLLRKVGLAAAAVLIVGLLSWNVLLQDEVRGLRGDLEQARSANQAPVERQIELDGTWVEQGTRAEVASLGDDRLVLIVEDIPSMPEDRTLQIWVIEGTTPEPGGLLEPAEGMAATPITTSLEGADAIAVTVEPAGGSETPTTDPVLLKEL